ncbi:hypothetical protein D3C75_1190540 [compost metagenome]
MGSESFDFIHGVMSHDGLARFWVWLPAPTPARFPVPQRLTPERISSLIAERIKH